MNHLQVFARDQGLLGAGSWWHFGDHEHLVRRWHPLLHIPIRHPMDVARSWAKRKKTGEVCDDMCSRYQLMLKALSDYPHTTLHRIEDLPRTHGLNEHVDEDRSLLVREYQQTLRERVVEPNMRFFANFYEDPLDGAGQL